MEDLDFLGEGDFTKKDSIVENALNKIKQLGERDTIYGKISLYLTQFAKQKNPRNMKEFRKRTASEIIESKRYKGCSDYGIVFCTLARAAGIPTKYIETIKKENLKLKPIEVEGHIFTELNINDKWVVYEPKNGFIKRHGYWLGNEEYIKIGEGLDFSKLKLNNNSLLNLNSVRKIKNLRDILN